MKKLYSLIGASFIVASSFSQNDVMVSATDNWVAYVNVFDLPANGGGYLWGSSWEVSEVKTTLDVTENTVTLQPNFGLYAADPTDAYWVDQSTMDGNKFLEASTFVEPGPSFNGNDLTFHGDILSNTLDLTQYEALFFIKALDSLNGYQDAFGGSQTYTMPSSGSFTVSVAAADIPSGLIVQYGFSVRGINADPMDENSLGSVVLGMDLTGVNESTEVQVGLYPNPASNNLNISTADDVNSINITNYAGQTVYSGLDRSIDISDLKNGVYFAQISTDKGVVTKQFVKN